jgi:hypothetical protein
LATWAWWSAATLAHVGLGRPLMVHVALRGRWAPPVDPWNPSGPPGTLPAIPWIFPILQVSLPIYKSLHMDYFGGPRDVPDPIWDSELLSDSPYEYPNTTLALPNVKCVTLRVREHADMIETPLRSIINSGTWMPILTPTYSTKISIGLDHNVKGWNNSVFHSLCLVIFYLPEIRPSVSPYLVQSRYRQVLFTHSAIQYPRDETHLSHACKLLRMLYYREGPEISLRHMEWQIPVLIHATQLVPSEIPEEHLDDHPVTKWWLIPTKHSSGIRD